MAYKCKSCKKVARGKKKKTASTLFKKHCCPGCGSYDFDFIEDTVDLIYDFEEIAFYLLESTEIIESSCDNTEEVLSQEDPPIDEDIKESIPEIPTYTPPEPSYTPPEPPHESSYSEPDSSSSRNYGSSSYGSGNSDSSSYDSDSSDCGSCDCGSCD